MFRKSLATLTAAASLGLLGGCASSSCDRPGLFGWLPWNRNAARTTSEVPCAPGCDGPVLGEAGPFMMTPTGQGPFMVAPPDGMNGHAPAPFPRLVPHPQQAQPGAATPSKLDK